MTGSGRAQEKATVLGIKRKPLMFTLLLTCVLLSDPSYLEGKVVRIAVGDTLTVLVDRMQVKVRLSEIDVPERGQDFSQRSRQALADLVFGKEVSIETHEKNRYVRVIGDVVVDGKPVNEVLVREGNQSKPVPCSNPVLS
jgi:endonuclease YncB( thermonuclease family)